ncbi:MAG: type II toxin-antitoxin system RelE/ParE family toxin [Collinsella sp.]
MIASYKDRDTEHFAMGIRVKKYVPFERVALRKIRQLQVCVSLDDLRVPPGNRLEALKGDRAGQYSIRVNERYRVCFEWRQGMAWNVEIVDYHK